MIFITGTFPTPARLGLYRGHSLPSRRPGVFSLVPACVGPGGGQIDAGIREEVCTSDEAYIPAPVMLASSRAAWPFLPYERASLSSTRIRHAAREPRPVLGYGSGSPSPSRSRDAASSFVVRRTGSRLRLGIARTSIPPHHPTPRSAAHHPREMTGGFPPSTRCVATQAIGAILPRIIYAQRPREYIYTTKRYESTRLVLGRIVQWGGRRINVHPDVRFPN